MEQYWPSELISEKARNTTGLVWPLQVSGVCLRLLMVTRGHWRPGQRSQEQDTPGQRERESCSLGHWTWTGETLITLSRLHTFKTGITTRHL